MSDDNSIERKEIIDLILSGRSELSPESSKKYLKNALDLSEKWIKSGGGTSACVLGIEAIKELALIEQRADVRATLWRRALKSLSRSENTDSEVHADTYLTLTVDIVQDTLSNVSLVERQKILREAKNMADDEIEKSKNDSTSALFLARKSSILRHQALYSSPELRFRMLSEAQRCATLAYDRHRDNVSALAERKVRDVGAHYAKLLTEK